MIRELIRFFIISFGIFALCFGILHSEPPVKTEDSFKVVDHYKGHEVVQYSPPNGSRYFYFLN